MDAARRAALRALRRRAGVLLQLGRRGGRGGDQVRAQGDRQARHRRARGLVPRPHARRALGRPASRRSARRSSRCVPGVHVRDAERLRVARGGGRRRDRLHPARARAGRGRHPPGAAPSSSPRRASSPTSAARCSSSTRCRPASGGPARFFAWEQLGMKPDAVTLAKGLANGLPIGALLVADERRGALRARRPREHVRRQPRRVRRGVRGRRDGRRRAARERRREGRSARATRSSGCRAPSRSAARGLLLGARDRPRRARRRSPRASSAALLVGTAGERVAAPDAAADDHRRRARARRSTILEEVLSHEQVRPPGRDPAPRPGAASSRRRRSSPKRCATRGYEAVQTTVSRDIAQLGLVKVRDEDGRLVYALPGAADLDRLSELTSALRRWALSLDADRQPARRPDAARPRERARAARSTRRGLADVARHDRRRQHDLRRRARRRHGRRARRAAPPPPGRRHSEQDSSRSPTRAGSTRAARSRG